MQLKDLLPQSSSECRATKPRSPKSFWCTILISEWFMSLASLGGLIGEPQITYSLQTWISVHELRMLCSFLPCGRVISHHFFPSCVS